MKLKSFKLWLNIFTIAALVALMYISRNQISETFRRLSDLNIAWLLMIVPLQLLNYFSVAKMYQTYLRSLGEDIKISFLNRVSLEMNFVNHVLPSGGVSGFGYLSMRLKQVGVPASKSTLTQVARHALTFISFIFYLLIAMLLLALYGNASRLMILISSGMISLVLVGSVLLIYLISSSERIKAFSAALPRLINDLLGFFRGGKRTINVARVERLFGDLHDDYMAVKDDWRALQRPFLWAMFMNLTEILTIMVVYAAFGDFVNPGAIIVAYAVANIAGLIAVLPGGVGVYEGLMTAVLASAGIPKALALSATLVYRVLNMLIFLPIGLVLYQIALRSQPKQ